MTETDSRIFGDRVFLRKMTEDDGSDIVRWRNDPEIKKWMFNQNELSIHGHVEWLRQQKNSNRLDYMICDRTTKEGIGTVNFINIEGNQAEAGKMLGNKDYWGAGYAKEAFRLWLNHGFLNLGFKKIYTRTIINNTPNIKLNEKIGFKIKEEARIQLFGAKYDILIMELKKDDLL